ncbi:MAG TPA: hypothetical protein PKG54_07530 [Phycisphaerae bacterium]|nr:hypothetical protein [Phycisphaerae bacterium]HOB74360.1 hypothetical protein [Phycisphaerae bacterium]HOJ54521.1 hypothetical protein [Phycisphaerae bacterium]HOL26550.1 hypothetical protein [Phycisphaerae bacterium]HPU33182.1 hypothetical protein [Phycisphaerae bacterium]
MWPSPRREHHVFTIAATLNLLALLSLYLLPTLGYAVVPAFMRKLDSTFRSGRVLGVVLCCSPVFVATGLLMLNLGLAFRTRRSLLLGLLNGVCALTLGALLIRALYFLTQIPLGP